MKLTVVAGARPNFMKIAPLLAEFSRRPSMESRLVHTGQHYDEAMSSVFFDELGIPKPDVNLEVGSASHAQQTAEIMKRFEPIMVADRPDAVVVVGDVNSTIACGLVAVKLGVKLIHVEAGLRSFDRSMPEEINRVLTDAISDMLFCTEESGVRNLRNEGIAEDRIHLVGNVMIDTLLRHRRRADASNILTRLTLSEGEYAVLTLHRPANVDSDDMLMRILNALETIQRDLPVVFPIHPRTRQNLHRLGMDARLTRLPGLRLIDPLSYLDFLRLMASCRFVMTDSGGIQEETTVLGVPCLTLRDNTERPVTVEMGTNQLVGRNAECIVAGYRRIMDTSRKAQPRIPPLWDGNAAERIAEIIEKRLC